MVSWPPPGTRVTVRYRRPPGSDPPLTDAVGHLLDIEPLVRVQTKTGAVVQFAAADVVAVRALSDAPVRASQIRALEHAAALACPGVEQQWLDGWLLRAGQGVTACANSAVPLDKSASTATIPAIVDWYTRRGLTPRLAVADRLLRLPGAGEQPNAVLVRDVRTAEPDPSIRLSDRPDDAWLQLYHREIPVDVLTAVVNGQLMFGMHEQQVARASVTDAPDGTRWVGLSAMGTADAPLCEALLAWGAARGASRGYVRVLDGDHAAAVLAQSLGFKLHHRARYFTPAAT
jgi:N-acetylglutamate synthase